MTQFTPFPKVPRLSREVVITEKIDGTNASVFVVDPVAAEVEGWPVGKALVGSVLDGNITSFLFVGSRKRFITPDDDNFGFAKWVRDNAEDLATGLGFGAHYGEWWGQGIQRRYGLTKKRFSLFNVGRWVDMHDPDAFVESRGQDYAPPCCHVVPVLATGLFSDDLVRGQLDWLSQQGSRAAPGFMNPEGIMVYHTAARQYFKKTFEADATGKEAA